MLLFFSRIICHKGNKLEFDTHVYNINQNYVHDSFNVFFRCYGNLKLPMSYKGKSGTSHLLLCLFIYIYNLFTDFFFSCLLKFVFVIATEKPDFPISHCCRPACGNIALLTAKSKSVNAWYLHVICLLSAVKVIYY